MRRVSRSTWDSLAVPRRCVCGNPIRLNDLLSSSFSTTTSSSSFSSPSPPSSSSSLSTSISSSATSRPSSIPTIRSSSSSLKPRTSRPFSTTSSLAVIPSLLPTQSAKLAALHGRLGLPNGYPLTTLGRALIDPTAESEHHLNNDGLSNLGNVLLGYYASEYLMVQYPRLPYEILKTAMDGYIGPRALAAVGTGWGVEAAFAPGETVDPGLLQFNRVAPGTPLYKIQGGVGFNIPRKRNRMVPNFENNPSINAELAAETPEMKAARESQRPGQDATTLQLAMASFVRAAVAGVYLHSGGLPSTKEFVHAHVLSRKLDVDKLFQFEQPTRELSRLCVREGFQQPIARLEKETGRYSRHAVFIVGVYSGEEKLGEGQGSSLPEAKIKAAISALKGWYLYSPASGADLPSKTDGGPGLPFTPAVIDVGDIVS
ncbi:hypothetical protein TWF102_008850 [Orbilia oligospora]|uniref:Large ribosomal subunit protein mL44 n=2 Tax=Orbilia oligospora TaxID=2813651 RepID=A0A7C8J5S9_ORBOL|nr:hypothetical protein TWF102_008850 [Orbilia oligospora]KAF3111180.1 hypothetical protein TWF103_003859 [Orbilia oligospora]KAF3115674.1 hypothetical protein TWF706_005785 [Orbilia oligospora]KAF3121991.1 hypothetical protein TWF594_002935 [Orbilia oligospora]